MRRRYDKSGILALHPQAFMDLFVEIEDFDSNEIIGDAAIVTIRGPLEHHDGWWTDSYDSIVDRVKAACESSASTIVLRIDSPGGELFGCFDAARSIRKRCAAAGKKLVAYVEGCACSAGYALACAAEQITISDTAFAGSIGVMITRLDVTANDAAHGVRFAMVASGSRKLDGHPHVEMSAGEMSAMQSQVDSLAQLFFELVASLRGVDAEAIAALNAGVFHGAAAVEARLADKVASFDELLASLANGGDMAGENEERREDDEESTPQGSQADVDEAREALERAAADGSEKAQRALDVLNESDEDEEEGEGEGGTEAAAKARRPAARAPASKPAASSSVSGGTAAELATEVARLSARVEEISAEKDNAERSALLAARADVGKPLIELLQTKPLAEVKEILSRMPAPKKPGATTTVPHTRGAGQTGGESGPSAVSNESSKLDEQFGLSKPSASVVERRGASLTFKLPTKEPRTVSNPAAGEGGKQVSK